MSKPTAKRITIATAKKAARTHAASLKNVIVDSRYVTLWYEGNDDRDAVDAAAKAIAKDLGATSFCYGPKIGIEWKSDGDAAGLADLVANNCD